jgi:hypothetical protein
MSMFSRSFQHRIGVLHAVQLVQIRLMATKRSAAEARKAVAKIKWDKEVAFRATQPPPVEKDLHRCRWAKSEKMMRYHDDEWGVFRDDDNYLFELLILEGINDNLFP